MKTPILRKTLLAALIAALAGSASAAGLGRINVFSSLGQPLRAEVEVAATPEEIEGMSAKVASVDAFSRANIEYVGELSSIRMAVERRPNGTAVVKISSDRTFSEPFVDMLIELNWSGGRLLREYTFLLDPAELSNKAKAAPVVVDAPRSTAATKTNTSPTTDTGSGTTARSTSTPTPKEPPPTREPRQASGDEYVVERGDTLRSIAETYQTEEVTRDQMLAALYQANKKAFIGNNINKLRTGSTLKVPDTEAVQKISRSAARKIVLNASNYEATARQVAENAPTITDNNRPQQDTSGTITTEVKARDNQKQGDHLAVSQTNGPGKRGKNASGSKVSAVDIAADVAAARKAQADAESRAKELEANIAEQKKLITLQNEQLAMLTQQLKEAKNSSKSPETAKSTATTPTEPTPKTTVPKPADNPSPAVTPKVGSTKPEQSSSNATQSTPVATTEGVSKPVENPVVSSTQSEAVSSTSAPVNTEGLAAATVNKTTESEAAAEPKKSIIRPPVAQPPKEESFLDSLLDNPLILAGGAGVVALLLIAYVIMRNRRRQPQSTGMTESSQMTEASMAPDSVFGRVGGQTVDTSTSMLHTDFSQSSLISIDTNEGVDPVAEADVYMAYGRDAQAEEILLDARKSDPGRSSVIVKLLEIYAQRQSVQQFDTLAKEFYAHTGGFGDEWSKIAELGHGLNPTNPLYQQESSAEPIESADFGLEQQVAAQPVKNVVAQAPVVTQVPSFGSNANDMGATWAMPGDLGRIAGGGDNDPTSTQPETIMHAHGGSSSDPMNLDFNLDLEIPQSEEPTTEMEIREEDESLFAPTPSSVAPKLGSVEMAYSNSFLAGNTSTTPAAPKVEPEPVFAPEQSSFAGDATNFAMEDLEKTNFEGSMMDFDFDLSGEVSKVKSPNNNLGLDTITDTYFSASDSVDGDTATRGLSDTAVVMPQGSGAGTSAMEFPSAEELDDEINTRLELARVYQETGDMEGARELLEEVIASGKPVQQEQARRMLKDLD